jgi:hypothetical protein
VRQLLRGAGRTHKVNQVIAHVEACNASPPAGPEQTLERTTDGSCFASRRRTVLRCNVMPRGQAQTIAELSVCAKITITISSLANHVPRTTGQGDCNGTICLQCALQCTGAQCYDAMLWQSGLAQTNAKCVTVSVHRSLPPPWKIMFPTRRVGGDSSRSNRRPSRCCTPVTTLRTRLAHASACCELVTTLLFRAGPGDPRTRNARMSISPRASAPPVCRNQIAEQDCVPERGFAEPCGSDQHQPDLWRMLGLPAKSPRFAARLTCPCPPAVVPDEDLLRAIDELELLPSAIAPCP